MIGEHHAQASGLRRSAEELLPMECFSRKGILLESELELADSDLNSLTIRNLEAGAVCIFE